MKFYEDGHTYIGDDSAYTSVTTLLKFLEKSKDWNLIAKKYGAKIGKSRDEVLAIWKEKKDKAAERGTAYHKQKQNDLNRVGIVQRRGVECAVRFHSPVPAPSGATGFIIEQPDFKLENNTIYTEFMVWDPESHICGMMDEAEVVNNTIYINDHKTNEEIKKEAFYIHNVGREKLLPPVSHLDNCNWNIYTLQLSLYMYMLWKRNKGFKVGKLTLNHVTNLDSGNPKVTKMDVPFRRTEAKAILDWWNKKRKEL